MKLIEGDREVTVNTISNWPLIEDLFAKWGFEVSRESELNVTDLYGKVAELSVWGIPWKWSK